MPWKFERSYIDSFWQFKDFIFHIMSWVKFEIDMNTQKKFFKCNNLIFESSLDILFLLWFIHINDSYAEWSIERNTWFHCEIPCCQKNLCVEEVPMFNLIENTRGILGSIHSKTRFIFLIRLNLVYDIFSFITRSHT